jgi:hypothetical protein
MSKLMHALLCAYLGLGGVTGRVTAPQEPARPAFAAYDVFVDAGNAALGAYQFEWVVRGGGARIVGVEGGEHPAFAAAPFYDPAALQGGRILIAAFSTAKELPHGRTRVARVHLMVDPGAAPQYAVQLQACADGAGADLSASVAWQKMESK